MIRNFTHILKLPKHNLRYYVTSLSFKAPPTGVESIKTYWVNEYLVKEGEKVKKDDIICILGTQKANYEMKAEYDGIMRKHLRRPETRTVQGEEFEEGDLVYVLDINS